MRHVDVLLCSGGDVSRSATEGHHSHGKCQSRMISAPPGGRSKSAWEGWAPPQRWCTVVELQEDRVAAELFKALNAKPIRWGPRKTSWRSTVFERQLSYCRIVVVMSVRVSFTVSFGTTNGCHFKANLSCWLCVGAELCLQQ